MATKDQFEGITAGSVTKAKTNAGATEGRLVNVPIAEIEVIDGLNPRDPKSASYKAKVRMLADSIKANGFKADKPLEGYVGNKDGVDKFFVTGGHRRLDGAKLANEEGADIERLPMIVKPQGTSNEDIIVDLHIGNTSDPLEPLELAEGVVKRLVGYGWDTEKIANRLAISTVYVDKLLTLAGAPAKIRTLVSKGQVSASLAMEVLTKKPAKAVEILTKGVAKAVAKETAPAKVPAKAPKAGTKAAAKKATAAAKKKSGKVTRKDLVSPTLKADAVLTAISTEHSGVEGEPEYVVMTLRMKSTEDLAALAVQASLKVTIKVEDDDAL